MLRLTTMSIVGLLALLTLACGSVGTTTSTPEPPPPPNQSNDRISITNDESSLEARIKRTRQEVPIDPVSTATASTESGHGVLLSLLPVLTQDPNVTLTLVAEVTPPTADGQTVQATSVAIKGDFAYVSYNVRGEPFLGAIDVFDIDDPENPSLISEAIFLDSDVHSLTFQSNKVYAVQGTGAGSFDTPAVFEVISTSNGRLILEGNTRVALPSFAGTSIAVSGSRIYVTSGNSGGLYVYDKNSFDQEDQTSLSDARWVDIQGNRVVVVQGGIPNGQLSVFDKNSLALLNTFSFTGSNVPESKSTVQVLGGKAFIAAGTGGVQILSINTGTVVGTVPLPTDTGLNSAVVVTNAVSADGDLLFISNGEAGVYLSQGAEDFDDTGGEASQDITLLGKLRFDDLQSVNHVAYEDDTLFVAPGLGGLKIVKVDGT